MRQGVVEGSREGQKGLQKHVVTEISSFFRKNFLPPAKSELWGQHLQFNNKATLQRAILIILKMMLKLSIKLTFTVKAM